MVDLLKVLLGVAALAAGNVHNVQQQAAALDMAQEGMTQAHALGSALDQAGDVGADKALFGADAHHAQHGGQGGEVVVGDFGLSGADHTDQRRFAHVGEADQPHVRNDLQFHFQLKFLAGQAGLGELGDLAGGGGKVAVAPAAATALGDDDRLAAGEVRHHKTGVGFFQHRAARYADDKVVAVGAGLALGAPVFAVLGGVLALVAEVHQGGEVVVRHKDDIAAAAAVTAVGTARRDKFFAVEGHHTVAALAGAHRDGGGINKIAGSHSLLPRCKKKRAGHADPPVLVFTA